MGVLLGYDMKRKREVYFFGGGGVGIGGRGVRLWYVGVFFCLYCNFLFPSNLGMGRLWYILYTFWRYCV